MMTYSEESPSRESIRRVPNYGRYVYHYGQSHNDSQQKVRQNRDRRQQRKQRGK